MCNNFHLDAATRVVQLHLKSLPPSVSDDTIMCYFECQGEDVDVLSVKRLQDDEAIVSLGGLLEEGMFVADLAGT